jgi:hypothetical protein
MDGHSLPERPPAYDHERRCEEVRSPDA